MALNLDEKNHFCGYDTRHWQAERVDSYLTPNLLDLFLCEGRSFCFSARVFLIEIGG